MAKGKPVGEIRRWRCVCAYDGTDLPAGKNNQLEILFKMVSKGHWSKSLDQSILTIGAGRTDAGVHAHGQVFHFDACGP